MRTSRQPSVLAGRAAVTAVAVVVAVVVLAPLAFLVRAAFENGAGALEATLRSSEVRTAVAHTVTLAVVVTGVAVPVGAAIALAFDRALLGRPAWWRVALVTPLLVPQFSQTLGWTQAYGPGGLLDHLAGWSFAPLHGPVGIALVLTVDAVPLVWLVVTAALAVRREPDLVRAARSSGASSLQTFRTIDLPLLRGPLLAAGAVVLIGVVNSFAVPQVLGSGEGYQTMATLAYQQLSLSASAAAFDRLCVLALLMAVLVLVTVGGADTGLGRMGAGLVRSGPGGVVAVHRSTLVSRIVAGGLAAYLVVTVAVPVVSLAATSLTRAPGLPPVPANWTLDNYRSGLSGPALGGLLRTLALAGSAAVLVTVLAASVIALGGSSRRRLGTAMTLGYAVPGTALAVGVLVGYGRWLGGSALIILLAYLAKSAALGYRALAAGADRVAPELGQAARTSGARPLVAFWTVQVRAMAGAYAAAAGLVVLFALHELTMSSILYGPGTETFAVVVLNQQQLGDVGASSALAVLLTLPAILVTGTLAAVVAGGGSRISGRRSWGAVAAAPMRSALGRL